jgi:inosine-uridine nucleoside N-ribohydrolase
MPRIILDTDGGVDDALALLLALAWPDASIEAICSVHGNVPLETATANVGEILYVAGREVPVARGAIAPLACAPVFATEVHGDDGLGGWPRTAPGPVELHELPAWKLIPALARRAAHELTLVTLGPLTNVALAFREDPKGCRMLKEIVVMGGAVWEHGNVTAAAEFNICADPEAARETLRGGVPVALVGLDVTRRAMLTRELLESWLGPRADLRARFVRCVCDQLFRFYQAVAGREMGYLHDPLAVAVALDRSLVRSRVLPVDVELAGELTRGATIADRRPWAPGAKNAEVCAEVDADRFLEIFRRLAVGQ